MAEWIFFWQQACRKIQSCFCWVPGSNLGIGILFCWVFCLFRQQPLLQVQLRVLQPWEAQRQEQGQELAWVAIRMPCRGLDCNITSSTKSSVKCSISMLPIPLANSVWISSISYSRAHKSLICFFTTLP